MSLFSGKKDDGDATGDPIGDPKGPNQSPTQPTERPNRSERAQQGGSSVANIGKSISIKGDLTGNEDMVIEGKVEGKIDLPNNQLTIGANGDVKAELHAKAIVVVGHVVGNVVGIDRVEIQATGRVEGNVTAPKLIVAEGAQLDGAIQMTGTTAASSGSSASPAQPPKPAKPEAGPETNRETEEDADGL